MRCSFRTRYNHSVTILILLEFVLKRDESCDLLRHSYLFSNITLRSNERPPFNGPTMTGINVFY